MGEDLTFISSETKRFHLLEARYFENFHLSNRRKDIQTSFLTLFGSSESVLLISSLLQHLKFSLLSSECCVLSILLQLYGLSYFEQ